MKDTNSLITTNKVRLGQLMLQAGFISQEDLIDGLGFSTVAGIPLGKALLMMNHITSELLEKSIEAQTLVFAQRLTVSEAVGCLKSAKHLKIGVLNAFNIFQLDPLRSDNLRLGNLLILQGCTSSFKIKLAQKIAAKTNKLLGETLVQMNSISQERLEITLKIQNSLKNLTKPVFSIPVEEKSSPFSLSELLQQSLCLNEDALAKIRSDSRSESELCIFQYANKLLLLLNTGKVSFTDACNSLKQFSSLNESFTFYQFLKAANFLENDCQQILITAVENNSDLSACLVRSLINKEIAGYSDSEMLVKLACRNENALHALLCLMHPEEKESLDSALAFYSMIQNKKLTLHQALLNFMIRRSQLLIADAKSA